MPNAINPLLAALWQKNLPQLHSRLELLDQAAATNPLPESLRCEAISIAHKLAGSLGMFGYMQATEIAREIELLLDHPEPGSTRLTQLTTDLRATLFSPTLPVPSR